jgi:hypothetical protein
MLAACGDSAVSPAARQRGVELDRPVLNKLIGSATIKYKPNQAIYANVGDESMIYIPEDAVCDLSSSYGPDTWDTPCKPAKGSFNITAQTWLDNNGHTYVQFSPALRFVPTNDPYKAVYLYVADRKAIDNPAMQIIYCPDTGKCIDEGQSDPTLYTFHYNAGVYRRIKHFSGYNVAAGVEEQARVADPVWSRGAGNLTSTLQRAKRSGYMVVSGVENDDDADDDSQPPRKPDGQQ